MMGARGTVSADEVDAFGARRYLFWQRGELRKIKRLFWKRRRKATQRWIAAELRQG